MPAAAMPGVAAGSTPALDRETYRRLAGRVKILSWASLAYMTLEGTVAILAGCRAARSEARRDPVLPARAVRRL